MRIDVCFIAIIFSSSHTFRSHSTMLFTKLLFPYFGDFLIYFRVLRQRLAYMNVVHRHRVLQLMAQHYWRPIISAMPPEREVRKNRNSPPPTNRKLNLIIRVVMFGALYRALLMLVFNTDLFGALMKEALFDIVQLFDGPSSMNIILPISLFFLVYLSHRLYLFRFNPNLYVFLYVPRYFEAAFHHPQRCNILPAEQFIVRTYQRVYKAVVVIFLLMLDFLAILIVYKIMATIYHNIEFYLELKLRILVFFASAVQTLLVVLFFARIYADLFNIIMSFSMMIFLRFWNHEKLLDPRRFTQLKFYHFRFYHHQNVRRIFAVNSLLGPILTVFFLINYPINSYLLTSFLYGKQKTIIIFLFQLAFMAHELAFIILSHLMAVEYR